MTHILNIPLKNNSCNQFHLRVGNFITNLVGILLLVATILLVVNPTKYIDSILQGTNLFYSSVMPSLLPFFFISKIIFSLGFFDKIINLLQKPICKIFRVPPVTSYVLLMSILCGYPVGAKIIGELKTSNIITDAEAKKMIILATTSGPIFVIGSVGGALFKSAKLGTIIFASHIIGALLAGFIFSRRFDKIDISTTNTYKTIPSKNILSQSINSTIFSILTVAIYVSIFYMFIDMAFDLNILKFVAFPLENLFSTLNIDPAYARGISSGIIEMTRGIAEISSLPNLRLQLVIATCLISFGGLSIFIQTLTFLNETTIKAPYLLKIKCLQTLTGGLVAFIASIVFF